MDFLRLACNSQRCAKRYITKAGESFLLVNTLARGPDKSDLQKQVRQGGTVMLEKAVSREDAE